MSTASIISCAIMLFGILLAALGGVVAGIHLMREKFYGPGLLLIGITLTVFFAFVAIGIGN